MLTHRMAGQGPQSGAVQLIRLAGLCVVLAALLALCQNVSAQDENPFVQPSANDVSALITLFEDPNVRFGASKALESIGKPAVEKLIEALRSDDRAIQTWSAYTLGQLGGDAANAVTPLAELLAASDVNIRSVTARAIGKIGVADAAVIAKLAMATTDENTRVRRWSIVALGELGPAASSAVLQLVDALDDQRVRSDAVTALIAIGTSALPILKGSLNDDDIRLEVASIIRTVDPAFAKQLGVDKPSGADLSALGIALTNVDKDTAARIDAAKSLGTLGVDGATLLVAALADTDPTVVRACSAAFGDIGAPAVPLLLESMSHESPQVRAATAAGFAAIGTAAKDATPNLVAALQDADRAVRHEAVKALDEIGVADEPVVVGLVAVVHNDRDLEPTRQRAIKTLARLALDNETAIAGLRKSTEDRNYGVSSLAKEVLKRVEP